MPHKRRTHEKPENMKKTMRQLLSYMASYKWGFVIGIVCAVASVSIAVIGPKITGEIITEIANGFMNKVQGIGALILMRSKKRARSCSLFMLSVPGWSTRRALSWRPFPTRSATGCVRR